MTNDGTLSKKDGRQLSPFFAHELLFDFVNGSLDVDRKKALEAELKRNPELAKELENIRKAFAYVEKLSKTKVSPSIFEEVEEPETYLSTLLDKTNYSQWPLTVKWAVEVMIVLAAFLTILIVIPWDQALKFGLSPHQREIILAEVMHPRADKNQDETGESANEAPEPAQATAAGTAKPVAEADVKKLEKLTAVSLPTPPPVEKPVAAAAASAAQTKTADAATTAAAPKPYPGTKAKPTEGSLYRGTLSVSNLQVVGPKIRDKIMELGGQKAGGVDLGWQKTPNSAYFHFTLPEESYDDLLTFLGDFGKPRVAKERHPRIMPQGLIRLIITVEETSK